MNDLIFQYLYLTQAKTSGLLENATFKPGLVLANGPQGRITALYDVHASMASQYISSTCSPPWAGLPIRLWFTGSTTKSSSVRGIRPITTGQSSGNSTTSVVHSRPWI